MRLQTDALPNYPVSCPRLTCVYNRDSQCDEPRINKGNSDAVCHAWSNRRLLEILGVQPYSREQR
jgi:hypothetical protein